MDGMGMFQVLDSFDAMVRCISQASRLQVKTGAWVQPMVGTLGMVYLEGHPS